VLAGEKVDVKENLVVKAVDTKILKEPSKKSTKSRFSFYRAGKPPEKKVNKSLAIPVQKVTSINT